VSHRPPSQDPPPWGARSAGPPPGRSPGPLPPGPPPGPIQSGPPPPGPIQSGPLHQPGTARPGPVQPGPVRRPARPPVEPPVGPPVVRRPLLPPVDLPEDPPSEGSAGERIAALLLVGLVLGGLGMATWELLRIGTATPTTPANTSADAPDGARAVADRFAALLQQAEDEGERAVPPDLLRPVVCDVDMIEIEQSFAELQVAEPPAAPSKVFVYTVRSVETAADAGVVGFERRNRNSGATETQDATLVMEGGTWQVCGLSMASASDPPPTQ